jgi:putative Holliday junction resolvase
MTMQSEQRILGIDYGSRRVGLALSDPMGIIAQPIDAVKQSSQLIDDLRKIMKRDHVKVIVVGMPLNLKGQAAQTAQEVQLFVEQLRAELQIEVATWDERFTTTIAQQTMITMGTKKKERQQKNGRIDSMAAAVMLQNYLDSRKQSKVC